LSIVILHNTKKCYADNSSHIHSFSYDANIQDFGKNNTVALDLWVFEQVKAFIEEQEKCDDCTDFAEPGNIFFLHLLGIDTAGHGYKPDSEYVQVKTMYRVMQKQGLYESFFLLCKLI
jgi:hypothetical protein